MPFKEKVIIKDKKIERKKYNKIKI
jgi:hypothetical protein